MGRPRAERAYKGLGKSQESLTLKIQINNQPLQSPSDSKSKVWVSLASGTQHSHTEMCQGKQPTADSLEEDQGKDVLLCPQKSLEHREGTSSCSARSERRELRAEGLRKVSTTS